MLPRILIFGVSVVFVNPDVLNQVGPLLLKAAAGLAITGLLGIFMWPLKKVNKEWKALKQEQTSIHSELVRQRENCLSTLQAQGATMIDLQSKTVGILEGVRLDLAEQTGYLRASVQPLRRRAAKK